MKKISLSGLKEYIFGIAGFDKTMEFRRLNDEITGKYPHLRDGDMRPVGARLRFSTDSRKFIVEIKVDNVYVDRGMSYYQANSGYVFVGKGPEAKFAGLVTTGNYAESDTLSTEFEKSGEWEDILVDFPRNPTVTDISIYIEDDAGIKAASPYTISLPIVFYGSSITEMGHTSVPNSYPALVSRWLDADYMNFGISGCAKGESEMAEFVAGFDMSVFVYDYDHNAPNAEHLRNTHEKFFRIFRSVQPYTPVIMMSKPSNDFGDLEERRQVILETCNNAIAAGDRNVYFIDGESFFEGYDREVCTTDRTHPNDLGHYLMAVKVAELIRRIVYNQSLDTDKPV